LSFHSSLSYIFLTNSFKHIIITIQHNPYETLKQQTQNPLTFTLAKPKHIQVMASFLFFLFQIH
jgi:hypothetical protein